MQKVLYVRYDSVLSSVIWFILSLPLTLHCVVRYDFLCYKLVQSYEQVGVLDTVNYTSRLLIFVYNTIDITEIQTHAF
jgi:hypothetical protein